MDEAPVEQSHWFREPTEPLLVDESNANLLKAEATLKELAAVFLPDRLQTTPELTLLELAPANARHLLRHREVNKKYAQKNASQARWASASGIAQIRFGFGLLQIRH